MRTSGLIASIFSVAGLPSLALAQQVAEGPPKVQNIRAVERGGFVETDVGFTYLLMSVKDQKLGLGLVSGIFCGFDIADVLSISLGATSIAASGSGDPAKITGAVGDLFFLIPMLRAQVALLTTERNFVFVRAGGGFAFGLPKTVNKTDFGGDGPAFEGLVGYEHFTKLRHFSIGITAGAMVVTKPSVGIGITLLPTLKYTF